MCWPRPSPPRSAARTSRCECRSNGGYVWFDVDAITPARDRPLDEVKDQVVARWRDDEIAARLKTKATEMLDKIKAGTSFADVAAAEQLKVEWRPGIKRSAAAARTCPPRAVDGDLQDAEGRASAAPKARQPTERIVFRVTEIKVPPLDAEAADAKRIDEALRKRASPKTCSRNISRGLQKRHRRHHQSEPR